MARRARELLATIVAIAAAALAWPALALAQQATEPGEVEAGAGGDTRGNLPFTGFETWEVAALGALSLAVGLLLVRRTREVGA